MTAVVTTIATSETITGGDGIGLSITVSSDGDGDEKPDVTPRINNTATTRMAATTETKSSFIPSSVGYSHIPFEEQEVADRENNNYTAQSTKREQTVVSSIMREHSRTEPSGSVQQETMQTIQQKKVPEQAHVVALEDRVRDLEVKLSTLSMLLLQQNQRHSHHRKPSSPESSIGDSSASPPETPFRSLSFATIPSSNVPVLDSPAPVSRRYRKSGSAFDECSPSLEQNRFRRRSSKMARGLRNNLSYRILHERDSMLDLRSVDGSGSDGGSSENEILRANQDSGNGIRSDDSFEKACRVPTLDSLPGSSRTSPILSQDQTINRLLTPDNLKDIQSAKDFQDKNELKTPSAPSLFGNIPNPTSSNSNINDRRTSFGKDVSSTSIPDISVANSAISDTSAIKRQKKASSIKSKWLDYLNSVQDSNYDTDKQMEEFIKVPSAVEALLSFGFWISVDSFLYTLTLLPLRFVYSIFLLTALTYNKIAGRKASGSFQFHRHNSYHLIQVSIIYTIYVFVLKPISVSILYHWIRSQSMVKLYLIVAMIEVFDRLMCSLGQDCLDSLYWNCTRRPQSSRLIVSVLVALVYTSLHSLLLFVHVATLHVAMNSDDQALLSLLIGGNFAEIKSTVFKKYNKATLFKIVASDICERFKLFLYLLLVLAMNASQGMDKKMVYNYLSMCGIVWCAEWLSDWLKHAFITKFNYIASGVYSEYILLLAGDVSGFGHEGENLDKSHAVVKRLGLAQIPLVCVMIKYLKEAYKYQTYESKPQTWSVVVWMVSIWLLLLVIKVSLASLLERMSRNKLESAPEFSKNNTTVAKKKN